MFPALVNYIIRIDRRSRGAAVAAALSSHPAGRSWVSEAHFDFVHIS